MNKGGSVDLAGLRITMTDARHSSGFVDGGQMVYLGEAAGYVVRLEDGRALYFAGDTCLFGDMRLIGELYTPEIAFLPIGDRFTMDPRAAAKAAELLGVRQVVPMHWGTFPLSDEPFMEPARRFRAARSNGERHALRVGDEVLVSRLAVDREVARAGAQEHPSRRGLAASGSVILNR